MRRFLLACSLLAFFSCTKDTTNAPQTGGSEARTPIIGNPLYAVKGVIDVKLTPEAASAVLAAQGVTRGAPATRSGIVGFDQVLSKIGAVNFERVFAYDQAWEDRYKDTGIDRWYHICFEDRAAMEAASELFAACPEVEVVEYVLDPARRRRMSVGPVRPLTKAAVAGSTSAGGVTTRAGAAMNDPFLYLQWHLDNTGPDGKDWATPPKAGADINLIDAWKLCTGDENVVVAVIDDPVQTTHPDLQGNMWSHPLNPKEHGYNFWNMTPEIDWRTSGYNEEYERWEYADHGSHVAGIIAATNNNGIGISSVAGGKNGRGVKIMSCQIMGYGQYAEWTKDPFILALEYAWKNGAVIAQNSWAMDISEETWEQESGQFAQIRDAIDTFIKYAGSDNPNSPLNGGLVIFAGGNDGETQGTAKTWPAAYPPVIAVTSTAWDFLPAYYTNYGPWADISAPGGDALSAMSGGNYYSNGQILSTILCDDAIDFKDGRKDEDQIDFYGYGSFQGTSMACPHVSGVAALGLSYAAQLGKKYTAAEFSSLLLSSVYGIDHYFTGTKEGNGMMMQLPDYKNHMGGGGIDALKLLLAIKGTPAVYVKTGADHTIDFSSHFGGANTAIKSYSASAKADELSDVGLASLPGFDGSKLTIKCSKPGLFMVNVSAKAGDKTISREFAIVSRAGLADNGGWL